MLTKILKGWESLANETNSLTQCSLKSSEWFILNCCCCSISKSFSLFATICHGLQHHRPPCPSPSPGAGPSLFSMHTYQETGNMLILLKMFASHWNTVYLFLLTTPTPQLLAVSTTAKLIQLIKLESPRSGWGLCTDDMKPKLETQGWVQSFQVGPIFCQQPFIKLQDTFQQRPESLYYHTLQQNY